MLKEHSRTANRGVARALTAFRRMIPEVMSFRAQDHLHPGFQFHIVLIGNKNRILR